MFTDAIHVGGSGRGLVSWFQQRCTHEKSEPFLKVKVVIWLYAYLRIKNIVQPLLVGRALLFIFFAKRKKHFLFHLPFLIAIFRETEI